MWATVAQRIVDTVVYTYAADWPERQQVVLSAVVAPVQLVGFVLDRLVGPWSDTLYYVVVARKPDGC